MKFNYNHSYERYPVSPGEIWGVDEGVGFLIAHDIYGPIPDILLMADMVITDLPYNQSMAMGYYTKAELEKPDKSFDDFTERLFEVIDAIAPRILFIEIGKQNLKKLLTYCMKRFPDVEVIHSTYHRVNPCYFIRCSNGIPAPIDYNGMDELDVIAQACLQEDYSIVADPLMGQGAVAVSAYEAGKQFVGTELNPKRVSVAIEKIAQQGGEWRLYED